MGIIFILVALVCTNPSDHASCKHILNKETPMAFHTLQECASFAMEAAEHTSKDMAYACEIGYEN